MTYLGKPRGSPLLRENTMGVSAVQHLTTTSKRGERICYWDG